MLNDSNEKQRVAIGVFSTRLNAELALQELRNANFPMDKVSIIAKNAETESDIAGVEVKDNHDNRADEGAAAGAVTGGFLGGVTGLLVGLGSLAIPGIGPIMFAGAEATAIATTLAGGAIGAATGSLVGALIGLGIPEERAKVYSELVNQGYYLILINGTQPDAEFAQSILSSRNIEEWNVYDRKTDGVEKPETVHYSVENSNSSNNNSPKRKFLAHSKYAVCVCHLRQNATNALVELRKAGYSMSKVYVVMKNASSYDSLTGIEMRDSIQDSADLGISPEAAQHYHERVEQGEYLLVIAGTDIEITAARSIVKEYNVEDFGIYDPKPRNHGSDSYNIISTNSNITAATPKVN